MELSHKAKVKHITKVQTNTSFVRKKVNGTVILSNTLKWKLSQEKKWLDSLKHHTIFTIPLNLLLNKNTESRLTQRSFHTLSEIIHGTLVIMTTPTSRSISPMLLTHMMPKLITFFQTQPILQQKFQSLSRHALLLKKLSGPMKKLPLKLLVFQSQKNGANLLSKMLRIQLLILLLMMQREKLQLLLPMELLHFQLIQLLLQTLQLVLRLLLTKKLPLMLQNLVLKLLQTNNLLPLQRKKLLLSKRLQHQTLQRLRLKLLKLKKLKLFKRKLQKPQRRRLKKLQRKRFKKS